MNALHEINYLVKAAQIVNPGEWSRLAGAFIDNNNAKSNQNNKVVPDAAQIPATNNVIDATGVNNPSTGYQSQQFAPSIGMGFSPFNPAHPAYGYGMPTDQTGNAGADSAGNLRPEQIPRQNGPQTFRPYPFMQNQSASAEDWQTNILPPPSFGTTQPQDTQQATVQPDTARKGSDGPVNTQNQERKGWWNKGDYLDRIKKNFSRPDGTIDEAGVRKWYSQNNLENATQEQRESAMSRLSSGGNIKQYSSDLNNYEKLRRRFNKPVQKEVLVHDDKGSVVKGDDGKPQTKQIKYDTIDGEAAKKWMDQNIRPYGEWENGEGVRDRIQAAFYKTDKNGNRVFDTDMYNKWYKDNDIGNLSNEDRDRFLSNAEQLGMWRSQNTDAFRRKFRTDAEAANFLRSNPAFMWGDNEYRNKIMATMKDRRGYVDPVGTTKQNTASANRAARTVNGMRQAQQRQIQSDRLRMAQFMRGAKSLNGRTVYGYNRWL